MKKTYSTLAMRVIRLRAEKLVATSLKFNDEEYGGEGDSNQRNTSSMIWGEEE